MYVEVFCDQCGFDQQQEGQCQYDDGWVFFDEICQRVCGQQYYGDGGDYGDDYDWYMWCYVDGGDDVVD